MRVHGDDRRLFYGDLFDTPHGDVNVCRVYPGNISGWHRHQYQTDRFFVVTGKLKFGLRHDSGTEWFCLDAHHPAVLVIPPGTWHGYANLWSDDAIYVMWADQKYTGADEERDPAEASEWAVVVR